jgi:sugar phosphate isomerase/epimerase
MTAAGAVQAVALGHAARASAASRPWGVQLYTVREQMKEHAAETLKAIADIGYKEIELLHDNAEETVALAKKVGLSPVSMHIDAAVVTGGWALRHELARSSKQPPPHEMNIEGMISEATSLGIKYLVVSYLYPGERDEPGFMQSFATQMNEAGRKVKDAGLQLCYHNHGFEFERKADGSRPIDALMKGFDPGLVKFELDVFWVSVTGADPVALLKENNGRVALVHLKDKARGAAQTTDERKVAPATFKELGSGSLDFPAILKAADAAGVEHYFVEQDHTPADPLASLKKSYAYLQQLT